MTRRFRNKLNIEVMSLVTHLNLKRVADAKRENARCAMAFRLQTTICLENDDLFGRFAQFLNVLRSRLLNEANAGSE